MPNIRKIKVCATCGKAEGQHWAEHWKKQHPAIQPRELLPGEAPTQPLDCNWIYLIKDESTREQFLKGLDKVVPPSLNFNQQGNHISNQGPPQPIHQPPQITNQNEQLTSLEHISEQKEEKEQEEHGLDFSSTPTQDLFKIAERTLQQIRERLVAKQKALDDRLTSALKKAKSSEEAHVRRIYLPQAGCHLSMTRVLSFDQVETKFDTWGIPIVQCTTKESMAPQSRQLMDHIIKEQERVRTQAHELESAIDCVRVISLPSDLTLNNCQAEVHLAEGYLSKRQRMLMRQPIKQLAAITEVDPRPKGGIKLSPKEEKAMEHPHLYGTALDRIQVEPAGPVTINVQSDDIGDDLIQGINQIDAARQLLTQSRHKVSHLQGAPNLRGRFKRLIDDMRDYLSRKLQHFLNQLLIPHPKVGLGKTEILLLFNSPFMKDRTFTVNVTQKERRNFTQTSTELLRSLETPSSNISNTASAIIDFTDALQSVEFSEQERVFLQPLMKEAINAVKRANDDRMMRGTHRMMCLQSALNRVAARLNEPNLLINLMDEQSTKKLTTTANLKDIVHWQMKRHQ